MNLEERVAELLKAWTYAVKATRDADSARAKHDALMAETMAELEAPPGWDLDIFGDGTLKPNAQCTKPRPMK